SRDSDSGGRGAPMLWTTTRWSSVPFASGYFCSRAVIAVMAAWSVAPPAQPLLVANDWFSTGSSVAAHRTATWKPPDVDDVGQSASDGLVRVTHDPPGTCDGCAPPGPRGWSSEHVPTAMVFVVAVTAADVSIGT